MVKESDSNSEETEEKTPLSLVWQPNPDFYPERNNSLI